MRGGGGGLNLSISYTEMVPLLPQSCLLTLTLPGPSAGVGGSLTVTVT